MKRLNASNLVITIIMALYLVSQGGMLVSDVRASEHSKQLFDRSNDPKLGNPNAKIKIVEFFDYNCGYCHKMSLIMRKLLAENKDIQVIFKELPILSKKSEIMTRASLASYRADPSKYMVYQEALFNSRRGNMDENSFIKIAGGVGIDEKAFKKAFDDVEKNDSIIRDNNDLAMELGIRGSPAYIIGDELIPGYISYEEFNAKIREQRKN